MLLLLVGSMCWAMAQSDVQLLRWTMWVPAVLSSLVAVVLCLHYGHRAWRVRRAMRPAQVTAT